MHYIILSTFTCLNFSLIKSEKLKPHTIKNQTKRDTLKRVKGQITKWRKVFAVHITDEQLLPNIHQDLLNINE